jgi:hypothetical protein
MLMANQAEGCPELTTHCQVIYRILGFKILILEHRDASLQP